MYGPEENSLGAFLCAEFCFPDSPDVSRDEVGENIGRNPLNQNFRAEVKKFLGVEWIATGPKRVSR